MQNEIQLKNISQLSGMKFIIPAYQRGYRWSKNEIEKLLNDIYEFYSVKKNEGEFYCLQPVVVCKKDNSKYEVIDGQQRLTTIFIILKYLSAIYQIAYPKFQLYSIQYETRQNSEEFLNSINIENNKIDCNSNIDFYFMQEVYDTIKEWFRKKDIDNIKFLSTLLSKEIKENEKRTIEDNANNVRIIWYEVADSKTDPIELFSRLNFGKIPLTNSELIKALLLNHKNFLESEVNLQQIHIATEWNLLEQKLQNNSFWYFIFPSKNADYDNRIEYLFDLMKNKTNDNEYYYTFNKFKEDLDKEKNAVNIWKEVKDYFLRLEEWYEDRELYHYIGFLIEYGENINNLCEQSRKNDKNIFLEYIKMRITENIKDCFPLEELNYSNIDKNKIRKILLLFNITTILDAQETEIRFPFNKFKTEHWDIEHICSQADKFPSSLNEWKVWANDLVEFLEQTKDEKNKKQLDIIKKLKVINECENRSEIEDEIVNTITDYIQENYEKTTPGNRDNISNLALLNVNINRMYGNAYFPIKRNIIIDKDKKGNFIPLATKNVFLKYYSGNAEKLMQWTQADADNYLNAIKDKLKNYTPQEDKNGK